MTEAAAVESSESSDARCEDLRRRLAKMDAAMARMRHAVRIAIGIAAIALLAPVVALNGCVSARFKRVVAREITLVDRAGHVYAEITNEDDGAKLWLEPVEKGPRVELLASAPNGSAYFTAKSGLASATMYTSSGRLLHAGVDAQLEDSWTRMSVDPMEHGASAVVWAHTDLFDGRIDAHEPTNGDRYLAVSAEAPNAPKAKAAMIVDDHGGVAALPSCTVPPATSASTSVATKSSTK